MFLFSKLWAFFYFMNVQKKNALDCWYRWERQRCIILYAISLLYVVFCLSNLRRRFFYTSFLTCDFVFTFSSGLLSTRHLHFDFFLCLSGQGKQFVLFEYCTYCRSFVPYLFTVSRTDRYSTIFLTYVELRVLKPALCHSRERQMLSCRTLHSVTF